jgi:hypothetical protein
MDGISSTKRGNDIQRCGRKAIMQDTPKRSRYKFEYDIQNKLSTVIFQRL